MSEFGIEEEFLLVDRHSLLPARSKSSLQEIEDEVNPSSGEACAEWLPGQIEFATPVLTTAEEAFESLHSFRRGLSAAARARGLLAVGLGTASQIPEAPTRVSDGGRYREFAQLAPGIAADQYVNGMHVHVDIPDREAGLRAVNGLRRWIPVLTALSANSPLWRGADSGFASWRSIHYRRWVVFGIPPHFHDLDDYDAQIAAALRSDVVLDEATLGWLVRLSPKHRTVEVRTSDVQLDTATTVTLALLTRALADVAMDDSGTDAVPANLLNIAHWQAARFGLTGLLMDPDTQTTAPAAEVVRKVFHRARPALTRTQDMRRVHHGLRRLLSQGTGSEEQRRVVARKGAGGLLEYAAHRLTDSSQDDFEQSAGTSWSVSDPP
ncbi:YbdK family carboxylate-amine ligase [Brevibacterium sp. CFH 10365]|uniref:carboxylate-amine ligase n=1 Tax=Brevibacterium sp. CFH 10365 TaxID=2585207 RepID=UPI0012666B83|nr:YbdK family carboxylate-amine ligase [Brevibacterium sp. CFH 10365]